MTIGERILELIKEKGMTQKEFSVRTGIPQRTISDWRGKRLNPGSDKIMIICDVLNIDPVYLISGTEGGHRYEMTDSLTVYQDSDEYQILLDYRIQKFRQPTTLRKGPDASINVKLIRSCPSGARRDQTDFVTD